MRSPLPYSKLYRSFISIERGNYGKVIQFFETNETNIRTLHLDEFREILFDFSDALFEAGQYERYIMFSLELLPISLDYDLDKNLYNKVLFRKSACYYNIGEYLKAEYILVQLCRINSKQREARILLKKCIQWKRKRINQKIRATAILLILLTALITSIEVLLIRPLYEPYSMMIEKIRLFLFTSAVLVYFLGMLAEWSLVKYQVKKLILNSKNQN